MRRLTAEAVRAGAIGVSTSRQMAHRFRDGRLAPSVRTEIDEVLALAGGLRDAGAGVFQLIPSTAETAEHEFGIIRRLAEAAGRPLSFTLTGTTDPGDGKLIYLDHIRAARAAGLSIKGQFFPRPIGMLFGLDLSYHPFALNPSYRPIEDLPLAEKVEAMRDPALRARLIAETPDDPNAFLTMIVQRTEALFPLGGPPNYAPDPSDSIAALAAARGVPASELIYDELLKRDGKAVLYCPLGALPSDATPFFDAPEAVLGLGDGGAHYGMICDASFPTFVLTQLTRDAPSSRALNLPSVVRALTRDAAEIVGFLDRGLVATGMKADLNVIDYAGLTLHAPTVVRILPAGGKRLAQTAEGYDLTLVSGQITYRHGKATDALPGRLIRGARSAPMVLA